MSIVVAIWILQFGSIYIATTMGSKKLKGGIKMSNERRREEKDPAWCYRCNRDSAFCLCACYNCGKSLDQVGCDCSDPEMGICECQCAVCKKPNSGAGLCKDCFPKWNESVQGPRPLSTEEVKKCKDCGNIFNAIFALEVEKSGLRTVSHFGFHNWGILLEKCPICLRTGWDEFRQGPKPSIQKGKEIDICKKCGNLFNPTYESKVVEAVEGVHQQYETLQDQCSGCKV